MKKSNLNVKIFLLIVLNVIIVSFADLFFKKGLTGTGVSYTNISNLWSFISANASSAFIWLGVLMYLISFIIWITILYQVELSIANPIGSISYILIPILAIIFLYESIPLIRWLGFVSIIVGIVFVSQSKKAEVV